MPGEVRAQLKQFTSILNFQGVEILSTNISFNLSAFVKFAAKSSFGENLDYTP